jgi:cell division transport system permease protein
MKIRTLRLLAKEGTHNVFKNKLMSFASIFTVVVTLFILGIVLLIGINITSNIETMKRDLNVTVFLNVSVSQFEREEVFQFIEDKQTDGTISEYRYETKEQAYENLRQEFENESLLKGLGPENMPESLYIKLSNPDLSDEFIKQISSLPGVNKENGIGYNKEALERLEGILRLFNYVIISIMVVLLVVSVLLISNTIRLTVYARRREIEIMKYVGALDNFIRWPFIVEGVLIGFIGAVISFVLTSQAYIWLQNIINAVLVNLGLATLRIMEFAPVAIEVMVIYCVFGVIIGGTGSVMSVRKHLNV